MFVCIWDQIEYFIPITLQVELHYSFHYYYFFCVQILPVYIFPHSWVNWFCRLRLNVWDNQCSLHCSYITWLSCGWIWRPRHREFQQLLGPQQRILSWSWLMVGRFHTLDLASPFILLMHLENLLHSIVTYHHHREGYWIG